MRHAWLFAAASLPLAANAQPPEAAPPLSDIRIDAADAEREAAAPARAAQAEPTITAEQRSALIAAVERGRLLFELARASQLTTRDMLARIGDPAAAGVAGWVALPGQGGTIVTYYADGPDGPVAVYRARVETAQVADPEVFAAGARPALGAVERRMAAARAAVAAVERQPCGPDFNVIVIPPAAADAPIDVYKLSPQTRRDHYPLGGHFRATVAADGSVGAIRGFTNRCLDLETGVELAGRPQRPIAVTHLLDPLPTEIHVFLSLWMNRPLVVATGERSLWTVARGRIGIVPPATATARTPSPPPPGPGR
jgi:hypothetical protein